MAYIRGSILHVVAKPRRPRSTHVYLFVVATGTPSRQPIGPPGEVSAGEGVQLRGRAEGARKGRLIATER